MSFYYLNEEMGLELKKILDKLILTKGNYSLDNIAITWINYRSQLNSDKGIGYGINNCRQFYPASLVKLVYGLAVYSWIEQKKILFNSTIEDAVFNMLFHSSNDATSFIIDLLTGTTSGPSLEDLSWANWKYQRDIINDWLKELDWQELEGVNCCQKTWEDSPYGREKDFYGLTNENRNSLTSDSIGRIMEEIMTNINFHKNNINLKNCLKRKIDDELLKDNLNNQIEGFLGAGIPEDTQFWSKAGLMSKARHDAAWWINKDFSKTLLVVFCEGEEFANDHLFLPRLSKEIYELNCI